MADLTPPPENSILERIKTIISPADAIALSQQIEHDITSRIHQLMLVRHAHLIELLEEAGKDVAESVKLSKQADWVVTESVKLSEQAIQAAVDSADLAEGASQAVMDSTDEIDAHADLITAQAGHRKQMVKFADHQDDARQMAQSQEVLLADDPASIQHVLEIVKLPKLTIAARSMKKSRIAEVVDALLKATEGW